MKRLAETQHLMVRGLMVLGSVVVLAGAVGGLSHRVTAAEDLGPGLDARNVWAEWRALRQSLDTTVGALELAQLRLARAEEIITFSDRYQIPADLAALIYDTALREAIDPDLAFRLVKVESGFNRRGLSRAGAVGLAQVLPATARTYEPGITIEGLYEPATNLRIGFRYLHDLFLTYGDLRLALLAYNRGPTRVAELLGEGQDPGNGYAASVMRGYRGM